MANPRTEGRLVLARLIQIDFPRMHIEDGGRPAGSIGLVQQPPGQPIGKQPPAAGTSIWKIRTVVRGTSTNPGIGAKAVRGAPGLP